MSCKDLINKRFNMIVLILVSCAYFLLFIAPNLTGAKNINMLVAFGFTYDEYIQFQYLNKMTTPGTSPYETLQNLIFVKHHLYGYPHYLTSAMSIIPLKFAFKFIDGVNATTAYMLVLRQLSPFFMLIAINLLIYLWTGFKSLTRSIFLFIFLSSIPAVFNNNMWWHPESLVILFVVLTIFSLSRDELKFGNWFYLAAVFCGLATGTKVIGLYFFFTVAVYLILGMVNGKIALRDLLKYGSLFFLVMVLTVIIANPKLFLPEMAQSTLSRLSVQAKMSAFGQGSMQLPKGPLLWYTETLKESFGFWWIYVPAICFCISGMLYDREKRLLNIIILTWALPLSCYLLFVVAFKPSRFFMPVFLPMMSCLGNPAVWNFKNYHGNRRKAALILAGVSILLCGLQLVYYTKSNVNSYIDTINREKESPSIAFYNKLDETYLSKLPHNKLLVIYRDASIYVPPLPNYLIASVITYADYVIIGNGDYDLILLERFRIEQYTRPSAISNSFNQAKARRRYEFYSDAKNDSISGFHKVFETEFGVAFARNK